MENEEILLEMLDIAISYMEEKEACTCCINCGCPQECTNTVEGCKTGIFEWLQRKAEGKLRNEKIKRSKCTGTGENVS